MKMNKTFSMLTRGAAFAMAIILGGCQNANEPPRELRAGTGTSEQAYAWAREALTGSGEMGFKEQPLVAGAPNARFYYCVRSAGSGGNEYAVFLPGPQGFRFVGTLYYGAYCVLPPDGHNRPRVATLWYQGIDEGVLSMHVLTERGLEEIAHKTVVPADVLETSLVGLMPSKVLASFGKPHLPAGRFEDR